MKRIIPIGPVPPPNGETGPRRGSDAPQYQRSDRSRAPSLEELETIEDCARIAERAANRPSFNSYATARDIARDIRRLAAPAQTYRRFICACGADWMTVIPDIDTCQTCYNHGRHDLQDWIKSE
jgi:hypothetical protein